MRPSPWLKTRWYSQSIQTNPWQVKRPGGNSGCWWPVARRFLIWTMAIIFHKMRPYNNFIQVQQTTTNRSIFLYIYIYIFFYHTNLSIDLSAIEQKSGDGGWHVPWPGPSGGRPPATSASSCGLPVGLGALVLGHFGDICQIFIGSKIHEYSSEYSWNYMDIYIYIERYIYNYVCISFKLNPATPESFLSRDWKTWQALQHSNSLIFFCGRRPQQGLQLVGVNK